MSLDSYPLRSIIPRYIKHIFPKDNMFPFIIKEKSRTSAGAGDSRSYRQISDAFEGAVNHLAFTEDLYSF
jgi:hypothetical protein